MHAYEYHEKGENIVAVNTTKFESDNEMQDILLRIVTQNINTITQFIIIGN